MTEWSTCSDELSRKALATLETWMTRHDAGEITKRELWLVCDALFDTVSGLANWESCADVIYAVRQSLAIKPF